MPDESVGTCGHAQYPDCARIDWELGLGIAFLRHVCGPEPPACALEVVWYEHDSGEYAMIVLTWEEGVLFDREWAYVRQCQGALAALDEHLDWTGLWEHLEGETDEDALDGGDNDAESPGG